MQFVHDVEPSVEYIPAGQGLLSYVVIPSFGHAGDGNLHIYICKDDYSNQEFEEKLNKIFDEMYKKAKEVGGLVSGVSINQIPTLFARIDEQKFLYAAF